MEPLRQRAWKVFKEILMRTEFKSIAVTLLLSPVLILWLTGCGNQASEPDGAKVSESSAPQPIGASGQLNSIQSDNVRAAGYDETSKVMTVQFDNGAIYEYYGVPADVWTSFIAAQPHPWSEVGYPRLVRGDIPFKRIG